MARPRKYNVKQMIEAVNEYTDRTDIPVLKELCYEMEWSYDSVMKLQKEHESLHEAIRRLLYKKEAQLERLALSGEINRTMAIFSLKQLGWSDRDQDKVRLERERLELDRQKAQGAVDIDLDEGENEGNPSPGGSARHTN